MHSAPPDAVYKRIVRLLLLPLAFGLPLAARGDSAEQRLQHVSQVVTGIFSYARWPRPLSPVRLCITGPTEYADLLLHKPPASPIPLQSRRLLPESSLLESQCDAVYLGILPDQERTRLLARLVGKPILTISESSPNCNDGSLFCLNIFDEQASFKVNLDAVERSGIRIHPNVLRLGRNWGNEP